MSKVTKKDRIAHLELQVTWLTNAVHELQGTENMEGEPQLKALDQSVFDGLDEKWRFAAVDADGSVRAYNYTQTPTDGNHEPHPDQENAHYKFIGTGYDASDWQNSLIERDDIAREESNFLNDTISNIVDEIIGSEYFYSNITSALLESGSKLVVCFVSDISESKALSNKRIEVITSLDTRFNDADDYGWQYAVPINNQGEPLTAKEAGL